MNISEILVFEYANKQNYVYNNIPKSIRLWKKMLKNEYFSDHSKYWARCALITQYRFLLGKIPILKPIVEDYFLQNKEYRKKYKESKRIMCKSERLDYVKIPITYKNVETMRIPILMAVFDKDLSRWE